MLGDDGSDCHHDVIMIDGKYNVDNGYNIQVSNKNACSLHIHDHTEQPNEWMVF